MKPENSVKILKIIDKMKILKIIEERLAGICEESNKQSEIHDNFRSNGHRILYSE